MTKTNMTDTVQLRGWRPDLVQRAVSALSGIVAAPSQDDGDNGDDDDERQLAEELVRWLRSAAQDDPAGLASCLEHSPPTGADDNPWQTLEMLLCEDRPMDDLIVALKERYADPIPPLCTLLEEAVSPDDEWQYIDDSCQRAAEALLTLGTDEALRFMAANVHLLCWDPMKPLAAIVQRRRVAFTDAVVEVWPSLCWGDRATLLLVFKDCALANDRLVELAVATDGDALPYDARSQFVNALAYADDPRAETVIRQLIDHALDEISHGAADDAARFVRSAAYVLVREMDRDVTPEQRKRAAGLGIDMSRRPPEAAAG